MFSRIRIEDTWDVRSPIALLVERGEGGREERRKDAGKPNAARGNGPVVYPTFNSLCDTLSS